MFTDEQIIRFSILPMEQSSDFYKKLIQATPVGYGYQRLILNEKGEPVDYEFLEVNRALAEIMDRKPEEIVHRRVTEMIQISKEALEPWIRICGEVALSGESTEIEYFARSIDRWFKANLFSAEQGTFVLFLIDITEEKRANQELEGFFDVNLDLLCIADAEGNFIKINRAWEGVLGYQQDEILQHKFLDFIHPDDLEITLQAMTELSEQNPVLNFVNRYRRKDGSYRHIEWRSHPHGKLVYASARDITNRLITYRELARQKRELESISHALDRSAIVSITNTKGRILKVNDEFCQISGYTREELLGKNHNIVNSGYHTKDFWKELWHTITSGKTWRADVKNRSKEGSYYWVDTVINPIFDENGEIQKFLSVRYVITDRIEAENILRESEERYTLATEGTGAGLWDWDMVKNRVKFSPLWKSMLGYTEDEIPNSFEGWRDLWHPDDVKRIEEAVNAHMQGLIPKYEVIHRLKHKDGTWRWILTRGKLSYNSEGQPIRWTGTNLDITQQKKVEEELRDYQRLMNLFFTQSLSGFFFMILDEPVEWNDPDRKAASLDYIFEHQRITRVNQAMLDQYRTDEASFLGLTPNDFFAHDLEQGRVVWRDFFDAGRLHIDTREQRFDGSEMWVEGDYLCMYDSEGRITGHFGIQNDVTQRKEAEEALRNHNEMQRILMKIASQYINIPLELVDDSINDSLKELGEFVEADRSYIFRYESDYASTSNEYEWCREGIEAPLYNYQDFPLFRLSEWVDAHQKGKDLSIANVYEILDGDLKQVLKEIGIVSLISVPMMMENRCVGFVGFDRLETPREHSEQEIQLLHLFSQMLVNIRNRVHTEQELVRLAVTDPLLGISNRAKMMECLMSDLHRYHRYEQTFSMIMFDIDHFKKINDSFGHDVGDTVLKEVTNRVLEVLRETDQFARWGGEEFMVLCSETSASHGEVLGERIRSVIEETRFTGAGKVTVSLGITEIVSGDNEETILKRVDDALYEAKEGGRNRLIRK